MVKQNHCTFVSAAVISFLFLSACSSAPKQMDANTNGGVPDWATHPQTLFPETRYLSAVGTGANRNEAIQDAKKNLAESFLVKVKSETVASGESTLNQDTGGAVSGSSSQNVNKDLSLSTDTFLRGADVKEVYEGKEVYALVALDKLKARSGLLMEAQRSQSKLDQLYDMLQDQYTADKWNEAQDELKKFDQLYSEASALGMSALVNASEYERKFGKLDRSNRAKLKNTAFTVKLDEGEQFLQNDLEECISEKGGTLYANSKAPEKSNKIDLNLIERPQHYSVEGWTKMRFDLSASVTQPDGKLIRIQTTKTEIGRSRDAVLESAADSLSKEFCNKLFSRLSEIANP